MVCKISFTKWNAKIALFTCVHGRYLLYQTFPNRGRQTQLYFNVSLPSSRRDNDEPLYLKNEQLQIFKKNKKSTKKDGLKTRCSLFY